MVRLFVAIDLPARVRERLRGPQEYLKTGRARLNIVEPSLIHVTLKFIGEVRDQDADKIKAALAPLRFAPFEFQITGISANNLRQPRVIWCDIADRGESVHLHAKIEDALLPIGIPRDSRPFRPHATLARVKQADPSLSVLLRSVPAEEYEACPVPAFSLKKSTLTPQGPRYETLLEVSAS